MDLLKTQTKYISDQLRTMSPSQQIAIGLLMVVVLGGLFQLMRWAGKSEWTPLLDQPFTTNQIGVVRAELAMAGVETKIEDDRVLIQGDDEDRQRVQAVLAQRGAMPRDTSLGYKALIENNSVFVSNQEMRWRQGRGLENELSAVLRRFQGIRDANVFIDRPQKRGFGVIESAPRASVHLTLEGDDTLDKKRVTAIANFVAGAVRGLAVADVKITDGVQYYRPPDPHNRASSDMLGLQRAQEDHYTAKIYDQLGFINGLVVNVHVKLRDVEERTENKELGKSELLKETTEAQETSGLADAAGPGVLPNQNRAITDAGRGSASTREKSTVEFNPDRDVKLTRTSKLAGFPERLTASINVPYSYLEGVFRQKQGLPDDEPLDSAQIDAFAAAELAKIQQQVKTLLQSEDDDQVTVHSYYDARVADGPITAADSTTQVFALARAFWPRAALAVLALFSLFVVFRIAKKAQSAVASTKGALPGLAASSGGGGGQVVSLGGGPATVGEAEGMHSAMVGHEVDERLVRTQQTIDQIGELVKEDPTSAASIVQGWLQDERS